MKQLLFLLLFPCLCVAQYTGNAGQKITLGEQTTADGLVYRGVLNDTALITPFSDTSAYIILDTVNNRFYNYKRNTNVWTQLNILPTDTASMLANYWRSGRFSGTLPVENGGTNRTTMPAGYILHGDGTSVDTAIGLFWNRNARKLGVGTNTPSGTLDVQGIIISNAGGVQFPREFRNDFTPTFERADLFFFSNFTSDNGFRWGTIASSGGTTFQGTKATDSGVKTNINFNPDGGNVGIGTTSPLSKLNVMGTVRINSASAPDANYYLQLENSESQKAKANAWDTYSDKRIKTDIQPIYNAIDKVNLLNPVYYQKHDSYVENDFLNIDYDSSVKSLGFIAQEVYNIIPEAVNTGTTNELWAMDYTKIIPILTKAIQEQNLLIKALEQRILILENK